ncbi:ABC transporter ATP-binding protein [Verticiella sediminum]|uniref:ABC transporter ATP-binding protein n=1 Tax=Verticiella sediminum TaxID=1247510 RepID=A0A556B0Y5_9BURK|nr:ABC transporter ATP-binding protein [Verticiella sediminum]TSH98857.1 ABC transporter ATP-binding protein [Verticiella sediminum]
MNAAAPQADTTPGPAAVPLLAVRGLSVRFATPRGALHALDDIDLDVPRGKTLAIVGESGSGKSVLSRAILRILPRSAEIAPQTAIVFDGQDLMHRDERALREIRGRRIGMVFQDPMTSLNPVRKIGAQLAEGPRRHFRLGRQAARARALDLLRQVGIPSPERRLDQYPHELSGGMRQRVVIAMAIACEPELLIADEPTTALDVTVQAEILDLLRRLREAHDMTLILITHDLGVAAEQADEIAVMYAGQVVERAPTDALFTRPRMPYSAALLRAIPSLADPPHSRLHAIAGRPPNVLGQIAGCRFAPRCGRAQPRCEAQAPTLERMQDGRELRCWYPLEDRP